MIFFTPAAFKIKIKKKKIWTVAEEDFLTRMSITVLSDVWWSFTVAFAARIHGRLHLAHEASKYFCDAQLSNYAQKIFFFFIFFVY